MIKRTLAAALLALALAAPAVAEEAGKIKTEVYDSTNISQEGNNSSDSSVTFRGDDFVVGISSLTKNILTRNSSTSFLAELTRKFGKNDVQLFVEKDTDGNEGIEAKYRFSSAKRQLVVGAGAHESSPFYYGSLRLGDVHSGGARISYVHDGDDVFNASAWKLFDNTFLGLEANSSGRINLWNSWQRENPTKEKDAIIHGQAYRSFFDYDPNSDALFVKATFASDAHNNRWYALGNSDAAYFRDNDGLEGTSPVVLNRGINANKYRPPISEAWRAHNGWGILALSLSSPDFDKHEVRAYVNLFGPHYLDVGPSIEITENGVSGRDVSAGGTIGYAFNGERKKFYVGYTSVEDHDNDGLSFQISIGK